jgi:chorismate mutase/prephenate dehydratase
MIIDVFEAVEKGRTTYGIVPYENSTFGSVVETLDYLIKANVKVRSETYLTVSKKNKKGESISKANFFHQVHQCLLSNSPLDKINKVYSHPQVS